jgi:hypothetical protein
MDNKTEKRLISFEDIIFSTHQDRQCNILTIANKEKELLYSSLIKKGFYNGCLNSVLNYNLENDILKINLGKTNFFDLILSNERKQKVFPALAVNAIIEVEDYLVFIKRGEEVYSYKGGIDFPAGLVPFNESLLYRLRNRIKSDTKLEKNEVTIGKIIPCAIIENDVAFNLFFNVRYNKSKDKLEDFFSNNFIYQKPFLVKKNEVGNFFKNNQPVFSEILNFI